MKSAEERKGIPTRALRNIGNLFEVKFNFKYTRTKRDLK